MLTFLEIMEFRSEIYPGINEKDKPMLGRQKVMTHSSLSHRHEIALSTGAIGWHLKPVAAQHPQGIGYCSPEPGFARDAKDEMRPHTHVLPCSIPLHGIPRLLAE